MMPVGLRTAMAVMLDMLTAAAGQEPLTDAELTAEAERLTKATSHPDDMLAPLDMEAVLKARRLRSEDAAGAITPDTPRKR